MKKNILLTALNLFIGCMALHAQTANENELLHPPPVINFYITGLCYGDTTYFISKTDIGEIYWAITNDKGDTLHSIKSKDTRFYFKKKGTYNICQTADNGHIATKIRTVVVDTVTHADFFFRPCINEFNNLSTCSDQFVWLMPDSIIKTDGFPSYQFKKGGTFPVKLTVKKGNKANTVTKMIDVPIDSLGVPDATFTFKRHGTSDVFDFKAVDSLESHYYWSFGDQQFDDTSGYKVTHTYDKGKYEAPMSLRISNGCGFHIFEADPFAVVGIKKYFLNNNTFIYPNPATEETTVSIRDLPAAKSLIIKLIDMNGAVLQEKALTASGAFNLKWNTSSLAKGIYLIQLIMDDQLLNRKLLIQ